MKKTQTFFILIVGMLLLAGYVSSTSAATTYELSVNNRTSKTLELGLIGPENHIITLPPLQKTHIDLKPGVYQYSFYDCGQLFIDTINMNTDRDLKLSPCSGSESGASDGADASAPAAELVDIVLNNKTYKQLTVALVGTQNYSFELVPGKTFVSVYKGTYQVSYYDCGILNISTVKINKDDFQIKILNCGQGQGDFTGSTGSSDGTSSTSGPEGVQFFVKNDTYSSFDILFLSDLVHSYHVIPGKNKITIPPGYYQYSYYACGELWVGNIHIAKKDEDMRIASCTSKSGRPDTGNNIEFKVKNLVGSKFTITLDGPQFYVLEVKAGTSTIFEVEKGYYTFQYYACGGLVTGEINLKDGVTLKTVNCAGD